MHDKAHTPAPTRLLQRPLGMLCLVLLPLLAVIPLLLPLTLLDGSLKADGSGATGLGSTSSGSSLKAPKNSGGFVINLPNSLRGKQRALYTTSFAGESLPKTILRHLAGHLSFLSTTAGTEVTNASLDRTGRLATYGTDGRTTVGLLLPSKEFSHGGLVAVQAMQKAGSSSKKGPQVPSVAYFTIGSDNLLLDVPAVLAASKSGNISDFELRFYNLLGQEKVRLLLHIDGTGNSVHLIF